MQLEFGGQMAPRGGPGATDLRLRVTAGAIAKARQGGGRGVRDLAIVRFKAGRLTDHGPVKAAIGPLAIAHGQLGGAVIGWGDGGADVLLHLPALHQTHHRETIAPPGNHAGRGQDPLRQGHRRSDDPRRAEVAAGKVAPVQIVADPVDRQHGVDRADAGVHTAVVLGHQAPALFVAQRIVGQPVQTYLPTVLRLQVTKLTLEAQAPLAHGARDQRGIAVGRNVPVIRLHQIDAADRIDRQYG